MFFNTKTTILRSQFFRTSATYARLSLKFLSALPYFNKFLRNLLDNAIKYSPDQPIVWVECGLDQGRVAIRVRDQGLGIAESERRTIFKKFMRGSAAIAANVKGSGIGLAMVSHIVAAHGGEITVASEPGRGSIFTMLFPAMERT